MNEEDLEPDGADAIDQRRRTKYCWQPVTNPATIAGTLMRRGGMSGTIKSDMYDEIEELERGWMESGLDALAL